MPTAGGPISGASCSRLWPTPSWWDYDASPSRAPRWREQPVRPLAKIHHPAIYINSFSFDLGHPTTLSQATLLAYHAPERTLTIYSIETINHSIALPPMRRTVPPPPLCNIRVRFPWRSGPPFFLDVVDPLRLRQAFT